MKTNKLKRIFFLTMILGFGAIFSSYASGPAPPAVITAKSIREKISDKFQDPSISENVPESGIVVVLFTVDKNGKIDIKKLDATTDEAATYVRDGLSTISCKDNVYPYNHVYKVRFSFE